MCRIQCTIDTHKLAAFKLRGALAANHRVLSVLGWCRPEEAAGSEMFACAERGLVSG